MSGGGGGYNADGDLANIFAQFGSAAFTTGGGFGCYGGRSGGFQFHHGGPQTFSF